MWLWSIALTDVYVNIWWSTAMILSILRLISLRSQCHMIMQSPMNTSTRCRVCSRPKMLLPTAPTYFISLRRISSALPSRLHVAWNTWLLEMWVTGCTSRQFSLLLLAVCTSVCHMPAFNIRTESYKKFSKITEFKFQNSGPSFLRLSPVYCKITRLDSNKTDGGDIFWSLPLCVCLCVSDRHFYPSTLTDYDETWSQGPYSDLVWPRP